MYSSHLKLRKGEFRSPTLRRGWVTFSEEGEKNYAEESNNKKNYLALIFQKEKISLNL